MINLYCRHTVHMHIKTTIKNMYRYTDFNILISTIAE